LSEVFNELLGNLIDLFGGRWWRDILRFLKYLERLEFIVTALVERILSSVVTETDA